MTAYFFNTWKLTQKNYPLSGDIFNCPSRFPWAVDPHANTLQQGDWFCLAFKVQQPLCFQLPTQLCEPINNAAFP